MTHHTGTSYYRAEFMGAHHERKAGARVYRWAQAYRLTNGETHFPRFSGARDGLLDSLNRPGSSWVRWAKGVKETVTCEASDIVQVTVRTVKARTQEQQAASKLAGERRVARNWMSCAANLTHTNWAWYTEVGCPKGDLKNEQDTIDLIIKSLRRLDELGIGR